MAKDKAKKKEDETEEKDDAAKDQKKGDNAKDAPEGEGAEGEEGAAPKKSKKKIIIIAVVALVVIIGGAAGAYFAFFSGHADETTAEGGKAGEVAKPVYYTMPEFLINLNTSGKASSFLKTTVILEVAKQEDVPLIEANLPRVVDTINTYLRELRASDLSGSAGIQRLREELLLRSNKALAPVKINDVLFKEIVVQ